MLCCLGRGAKFSRGRNRASWQFRNRRANFNSWHSHTASRDSHTTHGNGNASRRHSNTPGKHSYAANHPNDSWNYVSKYDSERDSKHNDARVNRSQWNAEHHHNTRIDLAGNPSAGKHDATFREPEQLEQYRNVRQRFALQNPARFGERINGLDFRYHELTLHFD